MKHDTRSVAITTGANVTFAYCELLSVCALGCIVRQRTNGRVDTPSTHVMDSCEDGLEHAEDRGTGSIKGVSGVGCNSRGTVHNTFAVYTQP